MDRKRNRERRNKGKREREREKEREGGREGEIVKGPCLFVYVSK